MEGESNQTHQHGPMLASVPSNRFTLFVEFSVNKADWMKLMWRLTSGVSLAMEVKSIDTICQEENQNNDFYRWWLLSAVCLTAEQSEQKNAPCDTTAASKHNMS